jgi:O-methyltransferase
MDEARQVRILYLDLMKRVLTNWVYGDSEKQVIDLPADLSDDLRRKALAHGAQLVVPRPFDEEKRAGGRDWPPDAHTMIGLRRLDNLQFCIEDVLSREVPGDLIETGVWRGGATIFMRAVLKANGVRDRRVWVADSFEGLPPPDPVRYPRDADSPPFHKFRELAIPLEQVKANFERYGLLDEQVKFLRGWFRDTLPPAPIERLAVVRLDGDMYESTIDGLENLYPKLSVGGFLIVDDYGVIAACREAVHDYRNAHAITEEIIPIDLAGVYWRRTG